MDQINVNLAFKHIRTWCLDATRRETYVILPDLESSCIDLFEITGCQFKLCIEAMSIWMEVDDKRTKATAREGVTAEEIERISISNSPIIDTSLCPHCMNKVPPGFGHFEPKPKDEQVPADTKLKSEKFTHKLASKYLLSLDDFELTDISQIINQAYDNIPPAYKKTSINFSISSFARWIDTKHGPKGYNGLYVERNATGEVRTAKSGKTYEVITTEMRKNTDE